MSVEARHILVVGFNHRVAPVALRERLAFRGDDLAGAFQQLRSALGMRETAILSTCNRVEIYACALEREEAISRLQRFLGDRGGLDRQGLAQSCYGLAEPDSVRHLFSVASGLDSMVLGEAEILHQVKDAYERARRHGATGKVFNVLFQRALNTAKAVRTRTEIGRGGTSAGSVAVDLAQKIFGDLGGVTALLIGAGEIAELTLKRLTARGVRQAFVINRSPERAAELAARYGAQAGRLERLAEHLVGAEVVIASTSAPGYLVSRAEVQQTLRRRRGRPLCLVDLGVPRNIDPAVGGLESVYLFNLDDLDGLIRHIRVERQQAVDHAKVIIDQKADRFLCWWQEERAACVPSSLGVAAAR